MEGAVILNGILFIALCLSLWGNWTLFCQREELSKDLADEIWNQEWTRKHS